jgi:hypothetical protein
MDAEVTASISGSWINENFEDVRKELRTILKLILKYCRETLFTGTDRIDRVTHVTVLVDLPIS